MINQESVLAIIPARGGSKGLKDKNIKPLAGKPLIAWTIQAALNSAYIDRVIVSSDSKAIIDTAKQYGAEAPFTRDKSLAEDESPTFDVIWDVLQRYPGYDWVVLLQPTSPLRIAEDIDAAIDCCIKRMAPACISVCLSSESPHWMYTLDAKNHMHALYNEELIYQRQKLPKIYSLNGAVYVARREWLLEQKRFISPETTAYEMPQERSVDVDNIIDFLLAETIINRICSGGNAQS